MPSTNLLIIQKELTVLRIQSESSASQPKNKNIGTMHETPVVQIPGPPVYQRPPALSLDLQLVLGFILSFQNLSLDRELDISLPMFPVCSGKIYGPGDHAVVNEL
jgi:hypothetical protein